MDEPETPPTTPPPGVREQSDAPVRACLACCGLFLLFLIVGAASMAFYIQRTQDPAYVATVFQGIVPCAIPLGYHGVQGDDTWLTNPHQAVLGPADRSWKDLAAELHRTERHEFTLIVALEVTESVGAAQTEENFVTALQEHRDLRSHEKTTISLRVRGAQVEATERVGTLSAGKIPVRVITVAVPRTAGSAEQVVLAFIGPPTTAFDETSMQAFLDSLQ
jgi:hypothetical protein